MILEDRTYLTSRVDYLKKIIKINSTELIFCNCLYANDIVLAISAWGGKEDTASIFFESDNLG